MAPQPDHPTQLEARSCQTSPRGISTGKDPDRSKRDLKRSQPSPEVMETASWERRDASHGEKHKDHVSDNTPQTPVFVTTADRKNLT